MNKIPFNLVAFTNGGKQRIKEPATTPATSAAPPARAARMARMMHRCGKRGLKAGRKPMPIAGHLPTLPDPRKTP
ncbi:hypothetical protein GCM10009094_41300 [Massilia aurea]|nr:hypothetical protein [Massilia aurea]MCS0709989.1 hypothetical protein [Massilia aurea]